MKFSLYQKLSYILVGIFVVMLSVFFTWSQHLSHTSKAEGEQKLHLGLAEHLVHDNPLLAKGAYDYDALSNLFHTLMVLGPSFEFYYLDPKGNILTYSAEPGKVKRESVDLKPIQALLDKPELLPVYGDDPRRLDKQKVFSAAPVYSANDKGDQVLQGYLYVIIGGEIYDNIFIQLEESNTLKVSATIALAGVIFLLIVLLGFVKYLTQPLTRLSKDMAQVADIKADVLPESLAYWQNDSRNEIHQLGSVFRSMAEQIQDQFKQLQALDLHRRELLADLSHDLRTPLASLQGYVETIVLKGDSLDKVERDSFINISLKNAKQLRSLIDQIFELAYLEGGQVQINKETFSLCELIYDVIAKFSFKAQDKNITLKVAPEEFPDLVNTDLAKLERVLSNLIDNAIRHTKEGGLIEIVLVPQDEHGQIKVEVRDNGVGISQQEVAYIFDARYRASNSQGKAGHNAGLGLAITKKLVNLLNSDIAVQSELGKGTCFSFTLAQDDFAIA